ncbi:MAG: metallophosphoesterase family protein [Promethearchaeota archaeon]
MNKLDLEKGEYPIIIKPNLGQPILINLREFKNEKDIFVKKITFNALIIALPEQSIQEILEFFYLNIYIQPILKDEGEFTERRGEKYPLQILEIEKIKKLDFRDQGVLEEENCIIWDIYNSLLKIDEIFGKRRELYKIKFKIKKIKSINRLLKETGRNLLLFDIVHDLPNRFVDKINYHSIALFDKKFADFSFIHATDCHVARRNDFILRFLKDKVREKVKLQEKHKRKLSKIDRSVLTRDFEFKEEFQEERLKDLRFARYNFNYNLRKLISYINDRVVKNELDFVLMTGDLIDYNNIASGNYQYENNFQVFIDILLGLNRGLDKTPFLIEEEFVNKQEILAPIFTIVGNHDYRKGHYGINLGNINQIFGMTKKEIKGYHDAKFVNYLKSIRSRDKYLKDYFRYVNPNLNFKVKIGKHYNFIFIDTGQDSIADMHDLLKGCPSTKGLKDEQIDLIRAYIQLSHDEKIVIVMHAPPISPNLVKKRKFEKKFKLKRELQWSDFYEDNLKKYLGCARLDKVLNLKYQTIMYNFSNFLRICVGADKIIRRKIDLILAGHAHAIKEYRLKEMKETETISMGFYFTKIPIDVPCEVYANKYRKIFKKFENPKDFQIWFDVNKPFIFQTQPVGPIGLKYKFKPPGFRYFIIKNDQIKDVKIYSLHLK